MARAQIELKREQGKCQTDLKNRLFKRVLVLVKEYMKTDDYKKILEKRIQKSLDFADGEEILIYINPSDAHLKDDLEAKPALPHRKPRGFYRWDTCRHAKTTYSDRLLV